MRSKLLYALLASSVAAGTATTASALILAWVPKGRPRKLAERYVIAPGQLLFERLGDREEVRRLRAAGEERLEAGRERAERTAGRLRDRLEETRTGEAVAERVSEELERLPHLYNVGAWTTAAFALSLLMTALFGVSSVKSALSLGFKVTLTLVFLQAALVLGGLLALQKLLR